MLAIMAISSSPANAMFYSLCLSKCARRAKDTHTLWLFLLQAVKKNKPHFKKVILQWLHKVGHK